ncbi:MAG: cytochrome bd-I oxidase subunit CydX [Arsenophonus sp.]
MWYFIWILGTLLACSFSIITVLYIDYTECNFSKKSKKYF